MGEPVPFAGELLEECGELLASLKADIPSVRGLSPDKETLARMQRHAHTAKGLIGFLGVPEMSRLAVRLEETLKRFRDGEADLTPETVDEIMDHATKLTDLLTGITKPAGRADGVPESPPGAPASAGAEPACPPGRDTRPTTKLFGAERLGAQGEAPSWNMRLASASRGKTETLSKAVAEVLSNFGVEHASCGQDSVGEFGATTRDLTVVVNSQGELGAAVIFGFDSSVAQALAGKISTAMFGGALDAPAGEEDEFVRGTLGEMGSFAMLACLNLLGLPPEFAAPRLVRGKGVKLFTAPLAARSFSVKTELGEFEVSLAPGASLSEREGPAGGEVESTTYRRKVVVADDSAVMRKMIERTLVRNGYDVVANAENGREAVEEFRRRRPDLVVLDLNMPVMGGLDALKIIRAEDPSARVLICSAITGIDMIRRSLRSGAVGYVTKPFDPAKLIETVEDLFLEQEPAADVARSEGTSRIELPSLGIYRVVRLIGEGGMAVVYEGYDPGLARKVGIKVIREKYAADVDFVVRFLEEARAVAKVSHPNVVTIYFAGSDKGKHFFAMELLPGPDLADLVERQGPLAEREALSYLRQGALGLAAAQAQELIHCDVKPANFVFGLDGLLKVTDFGIARPVGTEDNPTISEIMGTPCFMAPEQVNEMPIDHRSDIYSLGATLHFLLTGEPPYDGNDGVEVALRHVHDPVPTLPKASRKLRRLFGRMMAKSPDERHGDYDELLEDIDRLL